MCSRRERRARSGFAVVNEVHGPDTRAFLQRAGLKSGMRVADIGCGIGTISCWMAEQVGAGWHRSSGCGRQRGAGRDGAAACRGCRDQKRDFYRFQCV